MTPKNGSRAVGSRARPVINGSPWAYWPVYLGLTLAGVLVTTGLVFAVQSLKRPQAAEKIGVAEKIAEIPPAYSPVRDQANDSREKNLPALETRAKQKVGLPIETTVAKLIPALPASAAKKAPELVPPLPEKNLTAKAVPIIPEKCEPTNLVPVTPVCSTNVPAVCSTNVPDAAKNDPTYGTAIHFVASPTVAARDALKADKLVFVLHVSGNFEDPQFT